MTAKKQDAKKPEAQPQPAPATPTVEVKTQTAQPQPISKQGQTIIRLKEAWQAKGISLKELVEKQDGKFINLLVGEGWPVVQVGPTGGITLPEVRSYPKAFDAAVNGLELMKKQRERDKKKATATATPPVAKKEEAKPEEKSTPTARKQKANAVIEQRLEARA